MLKVRTTKEILLYASFRNSCRASSGQGFVRSEAKGRIAHFSQSKTSWSGQSITTGCAPEPLVLAGLSISVILEFPEHVATMSGIAYTSAIS